MHAIPLRCGVLCGLLSTLFLLSVARSGELDCDRIHSAVARGLEIVQKAARNYPDHRQCFSCHHQTLPLLAMTAARDAGLEIDEALLQAQTEFSGKSFRDRVESLRAGSGIGGRAMTVGYGLWTLDIADAKPNEVSEAMVTYLLKTQEKSGRWRPPSHRPPLEESRVMCTVLAVYGMQTFGTSAQQPEIEQAVQNAVRWLAEAPLESQEDQNARLWGLHLLGGSEKDVEASRRRVIESQHEDGGWSQTPEMASDAYATGQSIFGLLETGLSHAAPEIQKGVRFLLQSQDEDGSWFVQTRSRPVQVFFDNGDPHGKSQFISIPATSWATAALAKALQAEPGAEPAHERILLWPNGAPGAVGNEPADKPSLTVYTPPPDKANGCAVVVCPGGGYGHLAVGHEGKDVAEWFNSFGVTAFVLRYRIAPRYRHPAPMQDVQRAVRTARARAEEWNVDPHRIGVMGFSAGGHLASTAGTHFDDGDRQADDSVERVSCRPDFLILVYPVISFTTEHTHRGSLRNLLGTEPDPELVQSLSNETQVTKRTPPTFLMHSSGDTGVPAENSVLFYSALRRAGVPAEMHIYEKGKHGFGLAADDPVLSSWPDRCRDWLRVRGVLKPAQSHVSFDRGD